MRPVLILRPPSGADATAARARALGLEPVMTPLFRIAPRQWSVPETPFDAVLVTSANAARLLDERIDRRTRVYAVGSATTVALVGAGFANIVEGDQGVEQLIAMAEAADIKRLLHLAGEDRTAFDPGQMRVETRIVYASESVAPGPDFADALDRDAVTLLHSARAARRFRELAGTGHRVAAISATVLAASGEGWAATAVANAPTDDALLAAAAPLCH